MHSQKRPPVVCAISTVLTWGKLVRDMKAASKMEVLLAVLRPTVYYFKRIGLESEPLPQQCKAL
jgi:hypothetical protein